MSLDLVGGMSSQSLDIGVGIGAGGDDSVPRVVEPRSECVAVGYPFGLSTGLGEMSGLLGDRPVAGWHGLRDYEAMYDTPAVGSSVNLIRSGIASRGVALLPAVKSRLGGLRPGQRAGSAVESDLAAEIADSNRRTLLAWDTPAEEVIWEMNECLWLGHTLAEVVMDDVRGGPDDGLLAVKAVKPKPRGSYRFHVDRAMNVLGINAYAWDEERGDFGWQLLAPERFAWMTWDPYRGDPRGRSGFRMAHHAWRTLVDLWPEIVKGWKQFGTPRTYGTTAPNAKMVPVVDRYGVPIPGKPAVTAEADMARTMQRMWNGDSAAGPHGSEMKVVESSKDSTVVSGAIAILKEEIVSSLLLSTRVTQQAKFGSRADSETSQDVTGTLIRYVSMRDERFLRSILRYQNTLNYGEDIARRCTPLVDLGGTEHHDFAANAAGVGVLFQAGYFTEEQLPEVDTMLGLPQRQSGDRRVGPTGELALDDATLNPDGTPKQAAADAAPASQPAPAAGGGA